MKIVVVCLLMLICVGIAQANVLLRFQQKSEAIRRGKVQITKRANPSCDNCNNACTSADVKQVKRDAFPGPCTAKIEARNVCVCGIAGGVHGAKKIKYLDDNSEIVFKPGDTDGEEAHEELAGSAIANHLNGGLTPLMEAKTVTAADGKVGGLALPFYSDLQVMLVHEDWTEAKGVAKSKEIPLPDNRDHKHQLMACLLADFAIGGYDTHGEQFGISQAAGNKMLCLDKGQAFRYMVSKDGSVHHPQYSLQQNQCDGSNAGHSLARDVNRRVKDQAFRGEPDKIDPICHNPPRANGWRSPYYALGEFITGLDTDHRADFFKSPIITGTVDRLKNFATWLSGKAAIVNHLKEYARLANFVNADHFVDAVAERGAWGANNFEILKTCYLKSSITNIKQASECIQRSGAPDLKRVKSAPAIMNTN